MIWTHLFDLLFKLLSAVLAVFIMQLIPFSDKEGTLFLILATLFLFYVTYRFLFRSLATWLYCRVILKMKISFRQAKKLNRAFSPVLPLGMSWLPMKEIINLDEELKYETALLIYRKWAGENTAKKKEQLSKFKQAKGSTKILTIILYAVIVFMIIASFMNIPPASFVTKFYQELFDTNSYYPVLNMLLLTLPALLVFRLIDRKG